MRSSGNEQSPELAGFRLKTDRRHMALSVCRNGKSGERETERETESGVGRAFGGALLEFGRKWAPNLNI